jgi:nucleoside phosphorylase
MPPHISPVVDRTKIPITSRTQCKTCPATTVDLKLTVSAPITSPVSAPPTGDFLAVTWTDAETAALATVFGKGQYSFKSATQTNFTPLILKSLPLPPDSKAHAYFFKAEVNSKSVVCLKSEFHPKFDTASCTLLFQDLIGPASSRNIQTLVTSGTAGGIWANIDVGDVIVTNKARYGLTFPPEKQQLAPYTGLANITGSNPPAGYATWFDYATKEIIQQDTCIQSGLRTSGGRNAASGKPAIYYKPNGSDPTDVVTNSRMTNDELTKIATYRTLGATLDENDAYVADACGAVGFQNWISIRNVSDLPGHAEQYETFGLCSSLNGAYGIWAFIMGH